MNDSLNGSAMKCPKCGSQDGLVRNWARISGGEVGGTLIRSVAYCCENCLSILGVESDPEARNAQIKEIKETCAKIKTDLEVLQKKQQAAAFRNRPSKHDRAD